jgi:dTDP-4-dehydrorhamnose reductase
MRILITGSGGQLGSALHQLRPAAHGWTHADVDITDSRAVADACERLQPELIVHCAAWTAVDEAAREPEQVFRVNALGTQNLVLAAKHHAAQFVYVSTNEVFDGKATMPYLEDDVPRPINAYGKSKWFGEQIVQEHLQKFFIVRTSWLTARKGRNFVHRMIQLADEFGRLRVVTDEIACPTFVDNLAPAIWKLADTGRHGTYHLAGDGHCSRFEFAQAILAMAGRQHIPIEPITLAEFNRPSTPPRFSALANLAGTKLGISLPQWKVSLMEFLHVYR